MTQTLWTTREVAQLRELISKGTEIKRVAAILNRSYESVARAMWRNRITSAHLRLWTDEQDAALLRMLANGSRVLQISMQIGRSEKAVRNRMVLLGVGAKGWRKAA